MSQGRAGQTNPVLCLSEPSSVGTSGDTELSSGPRFGRVSDGRVTAVKMASLQSPGLLMAVWDHHRVSGSDRERSSPSIVTSSHVTLSPAVSSAMGKNVF